MSILAFLALTGTALAQKCPLQFDGRIPTAMALKTLDTGDSPYNAANVFGQNTTFSELVKFPTVKDTSLFDGTTHKPFEITLADDSIFAPSATNIQIGFRRAEFLPASNDGKDNSSIGIKTLHWSVMFDPARALNFSHEYQMVFMESADFSTNQFVLKTGTILSGAGATESASDPKVLRIVGNVNEATPAQLFSTPFTEGVFHNFALQLDFTKNTTQVFYSTGSSALAEKTKPLPNNISGFGQFHIGALKKPTGATGDVTKTGFQPLGIDEGLIYASVFMENSADGCISLSAGTGAATADANATIPAASPAATPAAGTKKGKSRAARKGSCCVAR